MIVVRKHLEKRNKMHNLDALQKQLDFLENIIEDALTTYVGDDCYYQLKQDYNAYQQEFYGIKEDRSHKDPGKARVAKTVRNQNENLS